MRSGPGVAFGHDLVPLFKDDAEVADDVAGALAGGFRAHDEAHAFRKGELFDDATQAGAFLGVLDLAGDAAGVIQRHEHEQPPGQGDVGGDARAFVAHGPLADLDQNLRADGIQAGDVLGGDVFRSAAFAVMAAAHFFKTGFQRGGNGVPEMQEGIFLQADVHKHGFEALLDVLDAALEDAAHQVGAAGALDGVFLQGPILQQSDPVLELLTVDDDAGAAGDVLVPGEKLFDFFDELEGHKEKGERMIRGTAHQ